MLKKIIGNILGKIGYVSAIDYDVAMYENIKMQQEIGKLSKKCEDFERINKQIADEMRHLVDENNSLSLIIPNSNLNKLPINDSLPLLKTSS